MKQQELLMHAREEFIKKFSQTPEDAGYLIICMCKKQVIFSKTKEVMDAFFYVREITSKTVRQFSFCVLGVIFLLIFGLWAIENRIVELAYFVGVLVVVIYVFMFVVNCVRLRKCFESEEVYLGKENVLIYNGIAFEDPKTFKVY